MSTRRQHGEGSIHRRSRDGRWVAVLDLGVIEGKRVRRTFTGKTMREVARRLEEAKRTRRQLAEPRGQEPQTVESFLRQWLHEVVDSGSYAPKTKVSYRLHVDRHITPHLGQVQLAELQVRDVQRFMASLRQSGLGTRSLQAAHGVLRLALNTAEAWDLIVSNPAARVRPERPVRDAEKVHAVDRSAVQRLLEGAQEERLGAMIPLLALAGLRKGELLALRWSRVDLDRALLTVDSSAQRVPKRGMVLRPTKSAASMRTIVLPELCVRALRDQRRRQAAERLQAGSAWSDLGLVFASEAGTMLDEKVPNQLLHRLCDRLGMPRERVHNLRHTAATIAGEVTGGDMHAVKHLLGHTSIATTFDLYRHLVPESQRQMSRAIDAYMTTDSRAE